MFLFGLNRAHYSRRDKKTGKGLFKLKINFKKISETG